MGDGRIFLKSLHEASFNKIYQMNQLFWPDPSRWTVPLKPWYLFTFLPFKFFFFLQEMENLLERDVRKAVRIILSSDD